MRQSGRRRSSYRLGVEQAGSDIVAFGKDVAQFAGDIGQALGFIGKVILNLPRLGFDAIGFTFWWGVDMVANAIWLPLVVVGVALLAYSTFALNVYPRIKTRLVLAVKARTAATWARFDTRFRSLAKARVIRADKAKEVVLEAAIENRSRPQIVTPPNVPPLPGRPHRSEPEEAGGAVSATELAPAPEQPTGGARQANGIAHRRRLPVETMAAELGAHLDDAGAGDGGGGGANRRNGSSPKTLNTEVGPVRLAVPRDRDGTFDPVLVPKQAARSDGLNAVIISLYAKGVSVGHRPARAADLGGGPVGGHDLAGDRRGAGADARMAAPPRWSRSTR